MADFKKEIGQRLKEKSLVLRGLAVIVVDQSHYSFLPLRTSRRKKTFFRLKNIHFCILCYKTFYVLTTKDQHGMTNQ